MKKIYIVAFTLSLCAGLASASASDLATILANMGGSTSLSSGVVGTYFSGTDDTNYILSTKNEKGSKAYATGSTATVIRWVGCALDPCGSTLTTDLLQTAPTTDNDAAAKVVAFGAVLGG